MTEPDSHRFKAGAAFIDGAYLPIAEASIPLLDWGFLRGDANQDTISAWRGSLFRLEDHLDRFFANLATLRMVCPLAREAVREVVVALVRKTGFADAYVQIINTRGMPPIGSRDPRQCQNRFQAFCIPFVWIATREKQETGLAMHTSRRWRVPAQSVSPRIKHYHWLDFQMSLFDAYDAGAETACCIDMDGNLAEGPGFNVMAVIDGEVRTPDEGVLEGMTRRTVLELCDLLQIPWRYARFTADAVRQQAAELFLTTTAGGVIPVTTLDGVAIGNGKPGPVTQRLAETYWARREAGWHATPVLDAGRDGKG